MEGKPFEVGGRALSGKGDEGAQERDDVGMERVGEAEAAEGRGEVEGGRGERGGEVKSGAGGGAECSGEGEESLVGEESDMEFCEGA